MKRLEATGKNVSIKLKPEALDYLQAFPEEQLIDMVMKVGSVELNKANNSIGVGWAKRNGWVTISNGKISITDKARQHSKSGDYLYRSVLNKINDAPEQQTTELYFSNKEVIDTLAKRNLVEVKETGIQQQQAVSASASSDQIAQLTREIIMGKAWKGKSFKRYDINAPTESINTVRPHPLHEFINQIRSIWVSMGFTEVTGPVVEPAFWNFDALMVPQDHPARDAHDTFLLQNPAKIDLEDALLVKNVKQMHTAAWKEPWSEHAAQQAVLRTHVTAATIRTVRKHALSKSAEYPLKLFSIGRTFRNEAVDFKHLAEFHQTEGIVIGDNLSLANLKWVLKSYYAHLGIDVMMRPSYFPFVEPGLELYYYDKKLNDSIELGGAGVIRREISQAMGTSKRVLAWGMAVERLALQSMGIDNITKLYNNEIKWLRERQIVKV